MRRYLNPFLIGADPEFAVKDGNRLVNVHDIEIGLNFGGSVGYDHSGDVVELRPRPCFSVYTLAEHVRDLLNSAVLRKPAIANLTWQAKAFVRDRDGSGVSCGGHIHMGVQYFNTLSRALDNWARFLYSLDIYPGKDRMARIHSGYGFYGEARRAGNHFEYRTFPTWLFHPKVMLLTLIGVKLCAAQFESDIESSLKNPSLKALKAFFEPFRGHDLDVTRFYDLVLANTSQIKQLQFNNDVDFREAWR